jgi:hypothetical protein
MRSKRLPCLPTQIKKQSRLGLLQPPLVNQLSARNVWLKPRSKQRASDLVNALDVSCVNKFSRRTDNEIRGTKVMHGTARSDRSI